MAYYELINLSSGNQIGEYNTEEEALLDVVTMLQRHGEKSLDAIALGQVDEGHGKIIAEGPALAQRATRSAVAA
jgi:hypothetical protein